MDTHTYTIAAVTTAGESADVLSSTSPSYSLCLCSRDRCPIVFVVLVVTSIDMCLCVVVTIAIISTGVCVCLCCRHQCGHLHWHVLSSRPLQLYLCCVFVVTVTRILCYHRHHQHLLPLAPSAPILPLSCRHRHHGATANASAHVPMITFTTVTQT